MNNNESEPKPGGHVKGPTEDKHPQGARTQKVQFEEPETTERYNLAFYANYQDKRLKEWDKAYLTIFHETFPYALKNNSPWATKKPQSRVCCKCQLIEEVSSLANFIFKIETFASWGSRISGLEEKFGTIFLAAHGNPDGLALPIADGSDEIAFKSLAIGLKNVDSLGRDCPKEWTQQDWKKLRGPFLKLKNQLDRIHKKQSWFDEETTVRLWCCNLGKHSGGMDTLKFFGETLVGINGHVKVEAPRCRSVNAPVYFTNIHEEHFLIEYRKAKRQGWWHPDIVAEVESDKNHVRFKKDNLKQAKKDFIKLILQSGRRRWIPFFALEDSAGRLIYQGKYKKFRNLWRTVII
jgi:hypothetical protein